MSINELPRQTLNRIVAKYGSEICDQPKRVGSLLRDLCGAYRRENNTIVGALEEGAAIDLLRWNRSVPREMLLAQLVSRLQENLAYTPDAARWAIDSWAVALGVLSETELQAREQRVRDEQEREQQQQQQREQQARLIQSQRSNQTSNNSNASDAAQTGAQNATNNPPANLPKGQSGQASNNPGNQSRTATPAQRATQTPPSQSQSPANRTLNQPPPVSKPSAPLAVPPPMKPRHTLRTRIFPLTNVPRVPAPLVNAPRAAPPQAVPVQYPQAQPTPQLQDPPKRRGLKLVGCFFTFVLIIVLIIGVVFVAPAIIKLLQDEQARPSINEPRVNRD